MFGLLVASAIVEHMVLKSIVISGTILLGLTEMNSIMICACLIIFLLQWTLNIEHDLMRQYLITIISPKTESHSYAK